MNIAWLSFIFVLVLVRYAAPLFIRAQSALAAHDVTATFKHRKLDLVAAAFDPRQCVGAEVYMRDDVQRTFVRLTEQLHAEVLAGRVKF